MEPDPPSPSPSISRRHLTLTDLNGDSLAHCLSFLTLQDISNIAVVSKPLRTVAYSDAVWRRLFTERWPSQCMSIGAEGAREKYFDRHIAVNQLKFSDPVRLIWCHNPLPVSHILLKRNETFLAQGCVIHKLRLDSLNPDGGCIINDTLTGHNARITCMRLLSVSDTSLFRSAVQNEECALVTSSSDRTIRIWWKGRSYRCFKGHNGPVTTLADKLLGDCGSKKVLASGGEDCTVRLWSVDGKHHPQRMTFHGHEKPVSLLSVAWHNTSLLVSMSTDSRVRVWDTTSPSSSGASSCVGTVIFPGSPVGMVCHESLCYIAAGSSVTAIDIRTMRKVATIADHSPKIYSFKMLPSMSLICTGGEDKALLWDARKNQEKPEPVAELGSHVGRVTMLHMDPYKIVSGGPFDYHANVWETGTGALANHLDCHLPGESEDIAGLSAMAVDGCRIITSGCTEEPGVSYFRDFSNCSMPISSPDHYPCSKFWEAPPFSDDDSESLNL